MLFLFGSQLTISIMTSCKREITNYFIQQQRNFLGLIHKLHRSLYDKYLLSALKRVNLNFSNIVQVSVLMQNSWLDRDRPINNYLQKVVFGGCSKGLQVTVIK